MTVNGKDIILNVVRTLPHHPGVYRMMDLEGNVLYVGKAKNLRNRVRAYTNPDKHPTRLQRMIFSTASMEIITTNTEVEALILESQLIKKLQPKYNILLKDDKSFPHIYIQKGHDYPQIYKKRGVNEAEAYCFGPFATIDAVENTTIALRKVFKLRNCTDSYFATRKRPCLQYHIKRCTAPCVGNVTQPAYADQVSETLEFLRGHSSKIQKQLEEKMYAAAAREEYEVAAIYRNQIQDLHKIQSHAHISPGGMEEADVMAIYEEEGYACIQVFFVRNGQNYGNKSYFPTHIENSSEEDIFQKFILQFYESRPAPKEIYVNRNLTEVELISKALTLMNHKNIQLMNPQRGEKNRFMEHVLQNAKEALRRKIADRASQKDLHQKLANLLKMSHPPQRIEVYDNSHIFGAHAIGAFIVAGPEGFMKKHYRKFTIKDPAIFGNDYGMMQEVFQRRFHKDPEDPHWTYPDVIIIDGGISQLNAVLEVFRSLDIKNIPRIMAIAKGPERHAGKEKIFLPELKEPIRLDFNDPLLFYLQRLRDEAHRFAIHTHRHKRDKAFTKSELDMLPGIGPKRKKALLHHFGSVKYIKAASIEDLQKVEGINAKTAQSIYQIFHP